MDEQEIKDRAGFQILMSARAHVGFNDEDADRILAACTVRCIIRPNGSNVDYIVAWRTFQDRSKKPSVGMELTVASDKKRYTFFKDYE